MHFNNAYIFIIIIIIGMWTVYALSKNDVQGDQNIIVTKIMNI